MVVVNMRIIVKKIGGDINTTPILESICSVKCVITRPFFEFSWEVEALSTMFDMVVWQTERTDGSGRLNRNHKYLRKIGKNANQVTARYIRAKTSCKVDKRDAKRTEAKMAALKENEAGDLIKKGRKN